MYIYYQHLQYYQKQLIEFGGPKFANLSQWFGFKSQAGEQTRSEFTKIHSVYNECANGASNPVS